MNINTINTFQSSFKAYHRIETAFVKVSNNLLLTTDSDDCSVLVLLATFGRVNYFNFLDNLET